MHHFALSEPGRLSSSSSLAGMLPRRASVLPALCRRLSTMSKPPADWKARAPAPPQGCAISKAQNSLQRLPVPALQDTLTRLRESLVPIAHSPEELKETERRVRDFERGLASELHTRLLKRQKETEHWLEEWWDKNAYMGYRDSVRAITPIC